MSMTKKYYEIVAQELRSQHELFGYNSDVIAGNSTTSTYEMSCKMFAQVFSANDDKFNKDKFLKGCGL